MSFANHLGHYLGHYLGHHLGHPALKTAALTLALAFAAVPAVNPATPPANAPLGFPFHDEQLNYQVKFPTGIELGEAHFIAKQDVGRGWNLSFDLDASLPAFPIVDHYHSLTAPKLCSIRFDRQSQHGRKQVHEYTVIDRARSLAVRATAGGGGLTEIPAGLCPHDALAFVYYLRRELGQGRLPAKETVLFGGPYQVSMLYTGEKTISHNRQQVTADQVNCTIKGPASQVRLEILFAQDAARTPLIIRCPFVLGTFSMELVR